MTSFPTSLDSLTNPNSTDAQNSPSHSSQHGTANDAIEALEAKVGINSSAVTTSHDYKLSGVTGTDKAVSKTGTETLTNKRITKRAGSTASSATPTINTDNVDVYRLTAQAAAITSFTTNLSGSPNHDDSLIIEITDDGTARAITWGASFESSGNVTLPSTTVVSTLLRVHFLYNAATSKWTCVGIA